MQRLLVIAVLLVTAASVCGAISLPRMAGFVPPPPPVVASEEFVGPFASWTNVKTACGATGNGTTDDTASIQTCLNGLTSSAPVLYFPSGTYKITACIYIGTSCTVGTVSPNTQNIAIICQDPATTTISWAGASGGIMLHLNDVITSAVERCTFNGNNLASVLLLEDQPDGNIGSNYYPDNVFENAGSSGATGIGFRCGNGQSGDNGCSEVVLLRDKFIGNSSIGAVVQNQNALNMWCWYCLFQNNDAGIGTQSHFIGGSGAVHVFSSVFQNSTYADIAVGNLVEENFVGNYSTGSAAFLHAEGLSGGSFPMLIMRNTVVNPSTSAGTMWNHTTNGPTLLIDNTIKSAVGAAAPVIDFANANNPSDLLSVGNTLTLSSAGNCGGAAMPISLSMPFAGSRCHEFGDQTVSPASLNPVAPTLPGVPPNNGRTIFDAAALTGAAIQTAINSAAAGCVNNVAHLRAGTYVISSTITVPANCRLQIIGDGWNSFLTASGAPNPMIKLNGPSQATLRDFDINGPGGIDAIEVDNADGSGALFYAENLRVASNNPTGVFVDGLDNTRVELHDFLIAGSPPQTGLKVVGGPLAAAGNWQGGQTNVFAVNTELTVPSSGYNVSNAGHLLVLSDWVEAGGIPYSITGSGSVFTHAGSSLALQAGNPPTLTNFQGTSALLAEIFASGPVHSISGTGSGANNLILGAVLSSPPNDTSSPAGTSGFLLGTTYNAVPPVPFAETGSSTSGFLTTTLNQLRSTTPIQPNVAASGVTNVGIWHVHIGGAKCAIHVEAGSGVTC